MRANVPRRLKKSVQTEAPRYGNALRRYRIRVWPLVTRSLTAPRVCRRAGDPGVSASSSGLPDPVRSCRCSLLLWGARTTVIARIIGRNETVIDPPGPRQVLLISSDRNAFAAPGLEPEETARCAFRQETFAISVMAPLLRPCRECRHRVGNQKTRSEAVATTPVAPNKKDTTMKTDPIRRKSIRSKAATLAASALVAAGAVVGAGAGAGVVEAAASGCSVGHGPTWTSSVCTRLDNGTKQRAAQWCASTGVGWQYGLTKTQPHHTSATPDCYGAISGRQQIIW